MKIFLDTANVNEIREAASLGLVDGVTTNPSLLAREKAPYLDVLSEICALVDGPISAEVVATDAPGMVREGRDLAKIAPNIVVKCPLTAEGLKDVKQIYRNYGFETQILVASIRNPLHVIEAALVGADIATMPANVYQSLLKHPLTDIGLARFLEDWRKAEPALKAQKIGTAV